MKEQNYHGCLCAMRYRRLPDEEGMDIPPCGITVHNPDCPIHTEQWRRDYLAWRGGLPI